MNEDQKTGRVRAVLALLPLVVVVAAPAVASWHGLVATGRDALGLSGLWAVLVPLVLDAAALYSAVLALRSTLDGDSALTDRALTWLYASSAAALNAWHAVMYGPGFAAAAFYALASLSAVVLWDRTLRQRRRDALRALGATEAPAPRYRAMRWLIRPRETWAAWSTAIADGITSPVEALERVRAEAVRLDVNRGAIEVEADPVSRAAVSAVELPAGPAGDAPGPAAHTADVTSAPVVDVEHDQAVRAELVAAAQSAAPKREALLIAWRELGVTGVPSTSDVVPAVEWLASRGVRVNPTAAYRLRKQHAANLTRPSLVVAR